LAMFKKGEIFDARERLIRLRKEHHGEEGLRCLEEFKKKLNFQELGFSAMEATLFDLIEKNPEATLEDLRGLMESGIKKYALTERQAEIIYSIFKGYQEKHRVIGEIVSRHRDDRGEIKGKELFKEFFGKEACDELKVVVRPMTINFCPKNKNDYLYLISDVFLEDDGFEGEDRTRAAKYVTNNYAGRRLAQSRLKGFDNILTVESPLFFEDRPDRFLDVLIHEEQHAFNALKIDVYNVELDKLLEVINRIEKESGASIPDELLSFLIKDYKIEFCVKDEISAYFKEGRSAKDISKVLLNQNTIYDFGFDYNRPKPDRGSGFDEKYSKLVKSAIIAFADLLGWGYHDKVVQSLLLNEPVSKWPRITERILGKKKSPVQKKRDEEKYISKVIYRSTSRTK
jgi:hypothetical protein